MKVLRTGVQSRLLADFHELRQDFSPPEQANLTTFERSQVEHSGEGDNVLVRRQKAFDR